MWPRGGSDYSTVSKRWNRKNLPTSLRVIQIIHNSLSAYTISTLLWFYSEWKKAHKQAVLQWPACNLRLHNNHRVRRCATISNERSNRITLASGIAILSCSDHSSWLLRLSSLVGRLFWTCSRLYGNLRLALVSNTSMRRCISEQSRLCLVRQSRYLHRAMPSFFVLASILLLSR